MKYTDSDKVEFPPGLVGEVAEYIVASAHRPVSKIALAGAIAYVASIAGRAYNVSGTGLNLYLLLIAATGRGKEAVSSAIDVLTAEVSRSIPNISSYVGPTAASYQGLVRYMSDKNQNSIVQMQGEAGIWLQELCSPKASDVSKGYQRFLLDVYTKSGHGRSVKPMVYADATKNTKPLLSPALTIFGDTTESEFIKSLSDSMISSGLLPRFLTVDYAGPRVSNNLERNPIPSDSLIEGLCALVSQSEALNGENVAIDVECDEEGKKALDDFDEFCDDRINEAVDERLVHLYNRGHLKVLKLSALIAVGCNVYDPCITREHVDYAVSVVRADIESMIARFTSGEVVTSENRDEMQLDKVRECINFYVNASWGEVSKYCNASHREMFAGKVIPFAYIQRKLSGIACFKTSSKSTSDAIKSTLKTLCDMGEIIEVEKTVAKANYRSDALCYRLKK